MSTPTHGHSALQRARRVAMEVERSHVAEAPSVSVRGEVDMSTTAELAAALDDAIRESLGALVVDLSEVDFLDSIGVKELLRARAVLGSEDRGLLVVCPPGPARRTLELTGAVELLALVASRAEVGASLRPGPLA